MTINWFKIPFKMAKWCLVWLQLNVSVNKGTCNEKQLRRQGGSTAESHIAEPVSGTEKHISNLQRQQGTGQQWLKQMLPCVNSSCAAQAGSAEMLFPACIRDEKWNPVKGTPQRWGGLGWHCSCLVHPSSPSSTDVWPAEWRTGSGTHTELVAVLSVQKWLMTACKGLLLGHT